MPESPAAEGNWESLIEGNQDGQGEQPNTVTPPPANPSAAVAADPSKAASEVQATTDPSATAADATTAGVIAPATIEPPAVPAAGEAIVDPSKTVEATGEEEETEADKAEFKDLPEAAQAPSRRYRKEARQFKTFKTEIGGEPFLEDAKLLVPAFHAQPAAEFDEVLQQRSPLKRRELYNHMVYTALDGPDRPTLINELVTKYKPEVIQALGIDPQGEREPSHVTPDPQTASAELATIEELLKDQYATEEQRAALEAAKKALSGESETATKLAQIEEELRTLRGEKETSRTQTYEQEEEALGGEFLGEAWSFAEERLNELGLSKADGDPPELVRYIESERKKILDLLPNRFEAHENAKKLISHLETQFKEIPKMRDSAQKATAKRAAWQFLPSVKVVVDEILGKEAADCLFAIQTARSAQQGNGTGGQRKEIVGHQSPAGIPPANNLVTGKGVDELWAPLLGSSDGDRLNA